jgi:hypothetical protein
MIDATDFIEKRRDKRFAMQNGIVALPGASAVEIGTIVDISRGGISIRYTPTDEQNDAAPDIDILLTDHNFYITGVPVTTRSNFKLENKIPFSYIYERRCGMQFGELTDNQLNQLNELLVNYVIRTD